MEAAGLGLIQIQREQKAVKCCLINIFFVSHLRVDTFERISENMQQLFLYILCGYANWYCYYVHQILFCQEKLSGQWIFVFLVKLYSLNDAFLFVLYL